MNEVRGAYSALVGGQSAGGAVLADSAVRKAGNVGELLNGEVGDSPTEDDLNHFHELFGVHRHTTQKVRVRGLRWRPLRNRALISFMVDSFLVKGLGPTCALVGACGAFAVAALGYAGAACQQRLRDVGWCAVMAPVAIQVLASWEWLLIAGCFSCPVMRCCLTLGPLRRLGGFCLSALVVMAF